MPSFVLRGRVGRAPADVFAVLADPSNMSRLFTGAGPDRVVGGTARATGGADPPPAMRAGARIRRRRTVEGTTVEGEADVEVFRPGKELSLRGEVRGIRLEQRWRLTPDGDGTKVEYECRVEGSGLASFMTGTVLEALRRADADHLERLRAAVESG